MSNKKQNYCPLVVFTILFSHIVAIVCVYSIHRKKLKLGWIKGNRHGQQHQERGRGLYQ